MRTIVFLFILFVSFSCVHKTENDTIGFSKEKPIMLDSINVVSLKEDYNKGLISLYNRDGSIWKSIELNDSFIDNTINPYSLKVDDRIAVFRCVGRFNNFYAIIIDENRETVKYIKSNVPFFNYETWQNHLVHVFSVDFDSRKNPLRSGPTKSSNVLAIDPEQFYHPVQIKDNWLEVKDDDDSKGWIKWIDERGKLLVSIYYEA